VHSAQFSPYIQPKKPENPENGASTYCTVRLSDASLMTTVGHADRYAKSGSAGSLYSVRYCLERGRRIKVATRGVPSEAFAKPLQCGLVLTRNSNIPCLLCRFRVWTNQTLPSVLPLAPGGKVILHTADTISPLMIQLSVVGEHFPTF
jgi:hypothetical protein